MFRLSAILVLILVKSSWVYGLEAEQWPIDWKPFKKHQQLYKEFAVLKFSGDHEVRSDYFRRFQIISEVLIKEPEWEDGKWMLADEGMTYTGTFTEESGLEEPARVMKIVLKYTEQCLTANPNHPLCNFYFAAALGRLISYQGIFSSLKSGKSIEEKFHVALNSPWDHRFEGGYTLKNSARVALGMFYRLVPDSILIKWLFGFRGDIDKSIAYHQHVKQHGVTNPCNDALLAAAWLCKEDDVGSQERANAMTILEAIEASDPGNEIEIICKSDALRLKQDTDLACGYTISKQQDSRDFNESLD
ncbi:MAG: hypothetical protein HRU19_28720 [Pseudobacteriovorax sp.]|nr:hypothetical protein [Pseudobacteriovorax sp.]